MCTARKADCDKGYHLPLVQSSGQQQQQLQDHISALLVLEQKTLLHSSDFANVSVTEISTQHPWSHAYKWHSTGLGCTKVYAATTTRQGVPLNQSWNFLSFLQSKTTCKEDQLWPEALVIKCNYVVP